MTYFIGSSGIDPELVVNVEAIAWVDVPNRMMHLLNGEKIPVPDGWEMKRFLSTLQNLSYKAARR
jgi:hypothetical protein